MIGGEFDSYDRLTAAERKAWDAGASAAITAGAPAELAAAMAETRQLRQVTAEVLAVFLPSGSGHTARVGQVQIRKWRQRAGIEA